jgi:hypothetical protein
MVTFSVKVAPLPTVIDASEQVTVPLAPGAGVVHNHPPGAVSDVKRRAGERTSVIVTVAASLGPLLETMMVYCRALPGKSVAGATLFVTARSASAVVCTLAVAESLIANMSSGEETVAVPESVDPEAVDESTFETTVNIACEAGLIDVVSEQVTVPLVPTDGVMHDHPAGGATETNVVEAGSGRLTEAAVPVLGPLFVTVIVHVRFVPAFTGSGDAASAVLKSDCVEMSTSTCAELSLSLGSGVVLVTVAVVL